MSKAVTNIFQKKSHDNLVKIISDRKLTSFVHHNANDNDADCQ